MKKKDVIQLVKETIKEMGSPYGHATLTTRDSGATHSRFTKTGRPPGVMETQGTLASDMLNYADQYHMELVDTMKGVSTHPDNNMEGTGAFYIKFPHAEGPPNPALFGKEVRMKIEASKAAAKAAAQKTVSKFQDQIEDYSIDTSKSGVYGNVWLWIMPKTTNEEGDPDITAPNAASPIAVAFPPRMPRLGSYEEELHYELEEFAAFPENTTDMAPKVMAPRIKKVFDIVNGTKNPVQTPEFWKNFFKSRYGIPFPETLENITKKQAIAMNKFGNDMKQHIKEEENYIITTKTGDTDVISADPMTMNKLKSDSNIDSIKSTKGQQVKEEPSEGNAFGAAMQKAKEAGEDSFELGGKTFKVNEMKVTDKDGNDVTSDVIKRMEDRLRKAGYTITKGYSSDPDLRPGYKPFPTKDDDEEQEEYDKGWYGENLTNDIGKDDYVDDEGRFAKSQIYKMGKYSMKLHDMLDDMEQLPAWLQSKITKASDYMSMVYHYLDYEFARRDSNLMESMDKHRKRNMLMEGAMKKFFEMFDKGMTDEEVVQEYAKRGTQIPETFIGKARKQYEGLKKMKLELEMSEKEYRNSATKMVNNAEAVTGMEMEEKTLASGLFKENNNNKK